MARPRKLTEEHLDEINGYIEEGITNVEIANRMGVSQNTIINYKRNHKDKISKYTLPEINMSKDDIKFFYEITEAYKTKFLESYKNSGYYPDEDVILSMLYWDYMQARVKYKKGKAKFSTYLIERFKWSYMRYELLLNKEHKSVEQNDLKYY